MHLGIWLTTVVACASSKDGDTDVEEHTEPAGPDELSDLPDVTASIDDDASVCAWNGSGDQVVGGASYLSGLYERTSNSTFAGRDTWHFFPNDTAEDHAVEACVVVWAVEAVVSSGGNTGSYVPSCPSCNLGIDLEATAVEDDSTCPRDWWVQNRTFTETYGIQLNQDGTAYWHHAFGEMFGAGYHNDAGMNYLSDKRCFFE